MDQIGEVEVLRTRIYNLDAECHCVTGSTVIVEPGRYPLYRDGDTTFWVMRGRMNQRGAWRVGDGLFALNQADAPSDIEVQFPSRRFGPDEWAELLDGPEFTHGVSKRLHAWIGATS